MHIIPYARQQISREDIDAVVEVLQSDWLTQGPAVEGFEKAVAAYCGGTHAVAVSSATAALHLACVVLDLGPGDVLWTSPNTFVASANCARYCGADVDFVDIDPRTYNLSIDALEQKLHAAEKAGRLPKIVVPVHFAGQPCDMAAISQLAAKYGFRVIEDASHAIGAEYAGGKVGDGRFSDLTVFSFHPVKILTSGEGGMLLTRHSALAGRLRLLRTHGVTREPSLMTGESEGRWYYQQVDLGFNYRLTDIQAALGTSQLRRIDEFIQRRRELAARYDGMLKGFAVTLPRAHPSAPSAWHLYVVQVNDRPRRQVFDRMRAAGILVNVHYIPVHLQPYYQRLGFRRGAFPNAEAYYAKALSLPLFVGLSHQDQDRVASVLEASLL